MVWSFIEKWGGYTCNGRQLKNRLWWAIHPRTQLQGHFRSDVHGQLYHDVLRSKKDILADCYSNLLGVKYAVTFRFSSRRRPLTTSIVPAAVCWHETKSDHESFCFGALSSSRQLLLHTRINSKMIPRSSGF